MGSPVYFIFIFFLFAALPESTPLQYSPEKSYQYSYSTLISFNEEGVDVSKSQVSKDVGLAISATIKIQPVWYSSNNMLFKLQISKAKLNGVARSGSSATIKNLNQYPVFFQWEGSRIGQVYLVSKDPSWSQNIKLGMISALQLQREAGTRSEADASGECEVEYKVKGDQIAKTKKNCKSIEPSGQFYNINPLLSVDRQVSAETHYVIADDIIKSFHSSEKQQVVVNMQDNLAAVVKTQQELKLEKTSKGGQVVQGSNLDAAIQQISKKEKLDLFGSLLGTSYEDRQCTDNCTPASDAVKSLKETLSSQSASVEFAQAFLQLVNILRNTKKQDILALVKNPDNTDILLVLIDGIVAAQTSQGQEAMMEFLNFQEEYDISTAERYLLAAAFSTHPSHKLLDDMLKLFKSEISDARLRESIAESLGALVYTYSRVPEQASDKIVKEIEEALVEKLKTCTENNCKSQILRALSNSGIANTVPILLEYAETSKLAVDSEAAIKALRRIEKKYITEQVRDVMKRIYHQEKRGYDSAVRSQALLLILDVQQSQEQVLRILKTVIGDPYSAELQTYTLARMWTMAQTNEDLRQKLKAALKDPAFRNWNIMAPGGKALSFKELMAETSAISATYDMFVENSMAHIMKRSGMDVDVVGANQSLSLYSFGLFAAGLEGLLGEEVEEGQEDIEPTAGLALNLIDVALRPVTFFIGQSGLMSAVWSAPSELVSAFQANLLLQDHYERLHLQNGMIVEFNVQGVVSMDLSGFVSISLWNKNCHTLIKNSGSLIVNGSLSLRTQAFTTGVDFSSEAASLIDFETNVDFYDKVKMCLQMSRPGLTYRNSFKKYEKAQGFRKSYVAKVRRKQNINPVSYPLPKPNNEMCRQLLSDN